MVKELRIGFGAFGLLMLVAGCGGGGASLTNFVGSWMYTSGTTTTKCMGQDASTDTLTGNIMVSQGTTSDLALIDSNCNIKLDVSGNTASAQNGQACTIMLDQATLTLMISAYTFSTSDGANADTSFTGNGTVVSGGQTLTCMITGSGKMTKIGK